jgi:hypothetical protein
MITMLTYDWMRLHGALEAFECNSMKDTHDHRGMKPGR